MIIQLKENSCDLANLENAEFLDRKQIEEDMRLRLLIGCPSIFKKIYIEPYVEHTLCPGSSIFIQTYIFKPNTSKNCNTMTNYPEISMKNFLGHPDFSILTI